MSKIAILLPKKHMIEQAKIIIGEKNEDILEIRAIETLETIKEVEKSISNGASIIIARGLQASYTRANFKIPLVEVVLTGQELGLIISKAKKLLNKEYPKIAIIGHENMFSDTTYFNEIYDIELKMYLTESVEDIQTKTEDAIKENVDIIVGGDMVIDIAIKNNIPHLFLESKEDSIKNAIYTARKMNYTAEIVRNHIAEFETILDTSFQGIIKINQEKKITVINKTGEEFLNKSSSTVVGEELTDVIKGINESQVDLILEGKQDIYNTSIRLKDISIMVTIVPIQNDQQILGAIVTCYKLNLSNRENNQNRRLIASANFNDFKNEDKKIKHCIEQAKIFALSRKPILIYGEIGTEKDFLAQAIHNNSRNKNGNFIRIDCSEMSKEEQNISLFGKWSEKEIIKKGAFEEINDGTIYISEIDKLYPQVQQKLFSTLSSKILLRGDLSQKAITNVRIIADSSTRLDLLAKEGKFRLDLFYYLNGLVLNLPPLRERREEIKKYVINKCNDFIKEYSKFIKISDEALEVISEYNWDGNNIQLDSFLERIFLITSKKLITQNLVKSVLDELYPKIDVTDKESKIIIYKHPEAKKIDDLLEKYNGSRKLVAKELNISQTTLWRHMKKYGVVSDKSNMQ